MKTLLPVAWAGIAAGFLTALPGRAWADAIDIRLLFNGKPLQSAAVPSITCRDDARGTWINCGIPQPAPGQNRLTMPRPAPGKYLIHVEVDDNPANPGRYAGDYDVFQPFDVTPEVPRLLNVDMTRLMHLTEPWDNGKPIEGMLSAPGDRKPAFDSPRYALRHRAPITFRWDSVIDGADYDYVVLNSANGQRGPDVVRGKTQETSVTLNLPPTPEGHYYEFSVAARAGGRMIGDFFVHDAGIQGWTCEFRIVDKTLPLWIYPAVLASVVAGLWLLFRIPWSAKPELLWSMSGLAVVMVIWQMGRYSATRKAAQAAQQAQAQRDLERIRQGQAFVEKFQATVPKPVWWDGVQPLELPINSLGDLMSVWQSGGSMDAERGKRFYRSAYQAVAAHPDDEQLVAEALSLMSHVAGDTAAAAALRKFWVERFFYFNQRTDNCAHCQVGDATGFMVRDLASDYVGQYPDGAIALIDRLIKERAADVSDYNLALALGVKSEAHWIKRDKAAAIADVQEGLRRFSAGWQADQLRKTLQRYQTSEPPDANTRYPEGR